MSRGEGAVLKGGGGTYHRKNVWGLVGSQLLSTQHPPSAS